MRTTLPLAATSFALLFMAASPVAAQADHDRHHAAPAADASTQAAAASMAEGTVRRVNVSAGTVTIAHGPLTELNMPPMTMTFKAKAPVALGDLGTGDKIRFVAGKEAGTLVVTAIEKLPN